MLLIQTSFVLKVLPLENEMKNPEDFGWVLNLGMGIVTSLFLTMGMFGFLTFGYSLEGSVTLNLPDHWYVYCFSFFLHRFTHCCDIRY